MKRYLALLVAVILAIVVGLTAYLEREARAPSASPRNADTPDAPREDSANSSSSHTLIVQEEEPHEPQLVDDAETLLESLSRFVEERNDDFARTVAYSLRNHHADKSDLILTRLQQVVRRNTEETSLGYRINMASYLVLALEATDFGAVLGMLRENWTSESLTGERAASQTKVDSLPLWSEYRLALIQDDIPLAHSVAYAIVDSAWRGELERFEVLASGTTAPYLRRETSDIDDLPDPWLSEVLGRIQSRKRSLTPEAVSPLKDYCTTISGSDAFSERLRYQARLIFQPVPETFGEVLTALHEAQTEIEAGSALRKYMNSNRLTDDELILLLAAIRGTDYADMSTVVLSIALQNNGMMPDTESLQQFALDILVLTGDDELSDTEVAQLCGVMHAAYVQANRLSFSGGNSRSAREPFFRFSGPHVRQRVRSLIDRLHAGLELPAAKERILAWEIAQMIVELDEPPSLKLELMRSLIDGIGGSRDGISSTVTRTLLLAHDRARSGQITLCQDMFELFLSTRGEQDHLKPKSYNSDKAATMGFAVTLSQYYEEYPELSLTSSAREGAKALLADCDRLAEQLPKHQDTAGTLEAVKKLRASRLLQ